MTKCSLLCIAVCFNFFSNISIIGMDEDPTYSQTKTPINFSKLLDTDQKYLSSEEKKLLKDIRNSPFLMGLIKVCPSHSETTRTKINYTDAEYNDLLRFIELLEKTVESSR